MRVTASRRPAAPRQPRWPRRGHGRNAAADSPPPRPTALCPALSGPSNPRRPSPRRSGPHMAVPLDDPLRRGQGGQSHGAAGVQLLGGDAQASAPSPSWPPSVKRVEALTMTAAESTAGDEAVHAGHVPGEDRLGVPGGVRADVVDGLLQVGTTRTARSSVPYSVAQSSSVACTSRTSWPAVASRGQERVGGGVSVQDGHSPGPQGAGGGRQEGRGDVAVDQERLGGVAHARRAGSWR